MKSLPKNMHDFKSDCGVKAKKRNKIKKRSDCGGPLSALPVLVGELQSW